MRTTSPASFRNADHPPRAALSILMLSLAAGLVWLAVRPVGSTGPAGSSLPATTQLPGLRPGGAATVCPEQRQSEQRQSEQRRPERQAVPTVPGVARGRDARPSPPLRVVVRGQLCRGGRPVPDCDVSFRVPADGAGANTGDWDLTDKNGRYEVALRAGSYRVRAAEDQPWTLPLVVVEGRNEIVLDLDLPPWWSPSDP